MNERSFAGSGSDSPSGTSSSTFAARATIAEAARRVGVHPNTVRRLIRAGRLSAELTRGRHGDTWIVDAAELARIVAQGRPAVEPDPPTSSPGTAPSEIAVGVDLSLDRARALERYTHGLLQPLVDLLRDREAALESRDTLLRTQAERIGRLERELELLRAERAARLERAARTARAVAPAPVMQIEPRPAARAVVSHTDGADDPRQSDGDGLPQQVTTLASQVGRMRADLQLIAAALRDGGVVAAPESAPDEAPGSAPAAQTLLPEQGDQSSEPAAAAVTPEELAGLFPAVRRGRLTLDPLDPPAAAGAADAPPVVPAHSSTLLTSAAPQEPTPLRLPPDDPFASAEAAVEELRRKLAPAPISASSPPVQSASSLPVAPSRSPATAHAAEPARRRRWWLW
jgi:excisionase family DNA binding protein